MATDKGINPWANPIPDEPTWESLNPKNGPATMRLRIPGGWLYLVGKFPPTFVPG